jgi:hypothetical protein
MKIGCKNDSLVRLEASVAAERHSYPWLFFSIFHYNDIAPRGEEYLSLYGSGSYISPTFFRFYGA